MTLVSAIITDAYRESNMLPLGKEPTADQGTEALRLYNAVLTAIYGGDAGEPLVDWPLGNFGRESGHEIDLTADRLARPQFNSRLIATNDQAMTVILPLRPQDGMRYGLVDPFSRLASAPVTLDANGRTIEGAPTLYLDTDGLFAEWLYRADRGEWLRVANVQATAENPFPPEFDMMFVILLAMRLNPRYGRAIDEQSVAMLKQNKRQFIARYLQSAPLQIDDSISWPFLSVQSYDRSRSFSSQEAFDRGSYQGK